MVRVGVCFFMSTGFNGCVGGGLIMSLLTVKEVADKLRISTRVVQKLLREGELKGYKIGKVWRIDYRDYEEFLKSCRVNRQPEDEEGESGQE